MDHALDKHTVHFEIADNGKGSLNSVDFENPLGFRLTFVGFYTKQLECTNGID